MTDIYMSAAALALLAVAAGCFAAAAVAETHVACVPAPPSEVRTTLYPGNRAPLAASPLVKLPIGSIRPEGWLRHMLELEAEGMTGRLTEISRWCKADGNAWLSPDGAGHSPWEELPYWLKGFGDLGYVLGDERIRAETKRWIEGILASRRQDGWFGPRENLTREGGKPDLWPNMVALNCLQSYYEASPDKRVLDLMTAYVAWLGKLPDADFLPRSWQKVRGGDLLETLHWLYNRTGDPLALEVAEKVHRNTADWTGGIASWHGVNICQGFREPAVFWVQAGDDALKDAAYRNYDTVMGLYGQVPGGMFGADENCRLGFDDPRQGAETCSMVEFMHSFEMLMRITGDPLWADRAEQVAFNSLPAAQPADQKGLRYLTGANMVLADSKNHAPGIQNGGEMLSFNPHSYRCCQHNVSHGWPYYAEEMWLATADRGLAAVLYAPSKVTARVAGGKEVTFAEQTDYPAGETVAFTLTAAAPVRFPLYLRVPGWCTGARVAVNGEPLAVEAAPLSFLVIDRTWKSGDTVVLTLPMRILATVWGKNHGAVSLARGPLEFSLLVGEEWKRYAGTDAWPALEVRPTTPWNYGLEIDPANPEASVETVIRPGGWPDQPFTPETAPVLLKAKARKIAEWKLDRHGLVDVLQDSPVRTAEPQETVTLIPMGAARLRIAAFPRVSTDAGARAWQPPPEPKFKAAASHVHSGDSPDAVCDGVEPKNSGDLTIPRFTWWDHKGTAEWIAARFDKPRTVSSVGVYWFDDTGRGRCRVPQSWRLVYRDGDEFKPVALAAGSAYGVAKDAYNKATFEPVRTTELRIEVQLAPEVSGGILEWQVE
jgi:hypothetical protein